MLATHEYAAATSADALAAALDSLAAALTAGIRCGVRLQAGGGLTYTNVVALAAMPDLERIELGRAVFARALVSGWEVAVRDAKAVLVRARVAARVAQ